MTAYKDIKRIPIVAADVPNLDTAKITTGTMADARISSSSVVQHSPSVDLTPVRNDIATLAFTTTEKSTTAINITNILFIN